MDTNQIGIIYKYYQLNNLLV